MSFYLEVVKIPYTTGFFSSLEGSMNMSSTTHPLMHTHTHTRTRAHTRTHTHTKVKNVAFSAHALCVCRRGSMSGVRVCMCLTELVKVCVHSFGSRDGTHQSGFEERRPLIGQTPQPSHVILKHNHNTTIV